jgi:hypothetical protein
MLDKECIMVFFMRYIIVDLLEDSGPIYIWVIISIVSVCNVNYDYDLKRKTNACLEFHYALSRHNF